MSAPRRPSTPCPAGRKPARDRAWTAERLCSPPRRTAIGAENRNLVIAQILEEGSRAELAWLAATVGREEIAAFVRERSGRKLSARNRRFWSRALGVAEPERHPLAEQLWPLA